MSMVPESPGAQAYALTDGQLRSVWNHICGCKAGETASERGIHFPKDTQLLESSSALTFHLAPVSFPAGALHALDLWGSLGGGWMVCC